MSTTSERQITEKSCSDILFLVQYPRFACSASLFFFVFGFHMRSWSDGDVHQWAWVVMKNECMHTGND